VLQLGSKQETLRLLVLFPEALLASLLAKKFLSLSHSSHHYSHC
jgi:hypothetical protein